MATLADIRDHIKADMIIGSDIYDSRIENAIRTALRQNRQSKYWFLHKIDTVTLISGNNSVNVPSDFSAGDKYTLITGGSRYFNGNGFDLVDIDVLERDYWLSDPVESGRPTALSLLNNKIYLSHIADQDYTISLRYYCQDAGSITTSTESVWFDDGYDVIRAQAQYIFKRDSYNEDPTQADIDLLAEHVKALGRRNEKYIMGSM